MSLHQPSWHVKIFIEPAFHGQDKGQVYKMFEKLKGVLNRFRIGYYTATSERRKYPRVPITVKVTNVTSGTFTYYQASNISIGGIFIKATEPLPKGTMVKLIFTLPGMDEIEIEGSIVRVQKLTSDQEFPSGMGVKFTKVEKKCQQAIDTFVNLKT